jgi:hypothetical protein
MLVHWSFDGFWLPSGIAEAARVTSLVENVAVPRCLHGGSPGVGDDFFIPVGWWGFKPWDILGWSLVVPYIERRNFARHLSKNWLCLVIICRMIIYDHCVRPATFPLNESTDCSALTHFWFGDFLRALKHSILWLRKPWLDLYINCLEGPHSELGVHA